MPRAVIMIMPLVLIKNTALLRVVSSTKKKPGNSHEGSWIMNMLEGKIH